MRLKMPNLEDRNVYSVEEIIELKISNNVNLMMLRNGYGPDYRAKYPKYRGVPDSDIIFD
jgi:hypothetical protein